MKAVTPSVSFKELEESILKDWDLNQIFEKQNFARKDAKEFAFYDGPPFANGLPHYGHLLANTIKDTVPRYWIMRGFKVDRRFGWDCHGLPVEFEIEKREKLKGRPDILKMGIEKFNETCRDSVLEYTSEWQKIIVRLGRWVDWNQQYRTMDPSYMSSVWWVFSELYKKGLVYQGFKVVPYSPRTSSVVSNFEANQNYKDTQDPSVVVKFKLKDENSFLLVWTTTPWTLPSNLALAVGASIEYVKVTDVESEETWILAKSRLDFLYPKKKIKSGTKPYIVQETISASDLLHKEYLPLFDYFSQTENAFKIVSADFVSTEDGTGIVHQAPAYGEDDFYTCQKHNIALVDPIDDNGCFTDKTPDLKGVYFKDADKQIIKALKDRKILIRQDTIVHSYPFDERTDTALMYKAVPSWYVAVEKIVDKLVDNNQKVNWVPSHIKDGRMGTWLKNARDWSISRNRFWGTPLPVWVCENDPNHVEVMSSIADLEKKSKTKIEDIHKHFVDKVHIKCPKCSSMMKVVDVVFDCWFESGSMPYAQLSYPLENKDRFEEIFPADFVAEGLDQTRGWFYTLNVLSNALFQKPAFKNVIVNGIILDEKGKKMSKRHRNYTQPLDLIDQYGADSVRLYMLNSPLLRAENLLFTDKGVKDMTRQVLLPLWNAYSFLSTYAEADGWQPSRELLEGDYSKSHNELDCWIISQFQSLSISVAQHMEDYKLYLVVPQVLNFIEDLTNWYIRLNRRRFWGASDAHSNTSKLTRDQICAYETLFYVLYNFSKVFAPFAPFMAEKLYRCLVEGSEVRYESVHLCDMPVGDQSLVDKNLSIQMSLVCKTINQARALRQKHKIKIRQVLPSMTVVVAKEKEKLLLKRSDAILKNELNVKEVFYSIEEHKHLKLTIKPNLKTLGRKLGGKVKELKSELNIINADQAKVVDVLTQLANANSFEIIGLTLTEEDVLIDRHPLDERLVATDTGVTILLDTSLNEDLIFEGLAREVINRIQNLRKDSGLEVTDRIKLEFAAPERLSLALKKNQPYILNETLATEMKILSQEDSCCLEHTSKYMIEDMACVIALETI